MGLGKEDQEMVNINTQRQRKIPFTPAVSTQQFSREAHSFERNHCGLH